MSLRKSGDRPAVTPTRDIPVLALREREAAAAIGVSVKTLRNWRYARPSKGPRFAHAGRNVVYPVAEIRRYLDENLVD